MLAHAVSVTVDAPGAWTVIVTPAAPPAAVAVSVAVPAPVPVTTPVDDTAATEGVWDCHVTLAATFPLASLTTNWLVAPIAMTVVPLIVSLAEEFDELLGVVGVGALVEQAETMAPSPRRAAATLHAG